MSASVNKVILLGYVGGMPASRSDKISMAQFSLATNLVWYDKETREKKEKTTWHRLVVFRPSLVEFVTKYITPGARLYVEGSIENRTYTDKSNIERQISEIVVDKIDVVTWAKEQENGSQNHPKAPKNTSVQQAQTPSTEDIVDDEIPF